MNIIVEEKDLEIIFSDSNPHITNTAPRQSSHQINRRLNSALLPEIITISARKNTIKIFTRDCGKSILMNIYYDKNSLAYL